MSVSYKSRFLRLPPPITDHSNRGQKVRFYSNGGGGLRVRLHSNEKRRVSNRNA
jgi:hypothetical protein